MSGYKVMTRFKVRSRVHRTQIANVLNKLTKDGWDIVDVMACYGAYTVVAKRKVRVKK